MKFYNETLRLFYQKFKYTYIKSEVSIKTVSKKKKQTKKYVFKDIKNMPWYVNFINIGLKFQEIFKQKYI